MPTYVKQSGVWKNSTVYIKQSGTWKIVQFGYVKQSGVWKEFFINRTAVTITISANTANYTLNTAKAAGYVAGKTDVTLNINAGVVVSSSSIGTAAFIVDTSWAAGDTITINNSGVILGKGGNGGNGGYALPTNGTAGGLALSVQRATSINNINRIAGGGGGGGGGSYESGGAGGGGGGGGIGIGTGGAGNGGGGIAGGAGTLTAAGSGGAGGVTYTPPSESSPGYYQYGGDGGGGGGYGSAGSAGNPGTPSSYSAPGSGGAAGAAITGNSNITWIATGTRNGGIS